MQTQPAPVEKRRLSLRAWARGHSRLLEGAYRVFLRLLPAARPVVAVLRLVGLTGLVTVLERGVKGLVFDCRMCGSCVLHATGMACPMTCPKNLRNGPCGGVGPGGRCEVDPALECVWLGAWQGAQKMRGGSLIGRIQEPLDHRHGGRSTWLATLNGTHPPDPAPPPAAGAPAAPAGRLPQKLRSGEFCVTAEFNPPDTALPEAILAKAKVLSEVCDAVNVTDGAGGNTHISSVAVCALLARAGVEAVMQISCRDRNRIAIQGEALGAAALGIRNILCLTGDGIGKGDQPQAKPVFDLDATSLLATLRGMREEGRFRSGRKIAAAPDFFLGATSNPFAVPAEVELNRLEKKIAAGALFIQTQFCFDPAALKSFVQRMRERGLLERCWYLVGLGPLASARSARWMKRRIPGLRIPDSLISRMDGARDPMEEGIAVSVEAVQQLREIEGVAGVHIMAFRRPEMVPEILSRAGLSRPKPA
ncbi:MAG: methylenetetrahydrofolate reductase C-terminal domain-containing protein [bacterium]